MKEARIRELLDGWLKDQLDPQDESELMKLLIDADLEQERQRIIESYYDQLPRQYDMEPGVADGIFRSIVSASAIRERPGRVVSGWWKYAAVAAIAGLVLLTGTWWLVKSNRVSDGMAAVNVYKNEVKPGGNHAVLTLSGGASIVLDSVVGGQLANQGGAQVVKMTGGSISYKAAEGNTAMVYNTLTTPAGGKYQLTLSDGTRVWLNALSSIRFPAAFNGAERTVDITGEAYFDVARNDRKPFNVRMNGLEIEVLGTSFNVNAYPDESAIRATLTQGAIRLVRGGNGMLLKPGEQGETKGKDGLEVVKDVDAEQAIAWKNGLFSFDNADVQTVMRQLSRWYGIEVRYEGKPSAVSFGGTMGRDLDLTQVLTGLSKSGIHFRLEGKVLTVLP